ncbi:TetR family transcriptional regulator [Shimia isoporae]|uniref:TetR family transcriptional regulator n=1 Tax=Shimia isoporae TaxID=647720 RepID=A0A4R1NKH9_9RHOB|nr:TetR/AcrR family transcriptional regulator [Shimia isoporae]TCL08585.1 TetR family transcriptional regulator [Shimia isoporae]
MNKAVKTTEATEAKIIAAATRCFVRYGARKTSMNDIAREAGLSRQTIYDLLGGKDDLICACIRTITDQNLSDVRARLEKSTSLAESLEIYFAETIVKSFELLQTSGDAEDLISGHNDAGKEEIARSHLKHESLVTELLSPYTESLRSLNLTPAEQAHFLVTVVMGLKYGAKSRNDLDALLDALKRNILNASSA